MGRIRTENLTTDIWTQWQSAEQVTKQCDIALSGRKTFK